MKNKQSVQNLKRNLVVTIISLVITVFSLVSITLCWYYVNLFNNTKAQGFVSGSVAVGTIVIGGGETGDQTEFVCDNLVFARPTLTESATKISSTEWKVHTPIGLQTIDQLPCYSAKISIQSEGVAAIKLTAECNDAVEFALVDVANGYKILACSNFKYRESDEKQGLTQTAKDTFDAINGNVYLYIWIDVDGSQAVKDSQQVVNLLFTIA